MSLSDEPGADGTRKPEAVISLSEVLVAFQKSLAIAQSQSATVKQTPEFFLGERALLDIDALDVELKLGISVIPSPVDVDPLKVNFTPSPESASCVKFRVKINPTEAIGSGVAILRLSGASDRICIITFAQGKAVPSKVNLHLASRWVSPDPKTAEKASDSGELTKVIEGTDPQPDPRTQGILLPNIPTDLTGRCVVTAEIAGDKLLLTANGISYTLDPEWPAPEGIQLHSKEYFQQTMIWASIGSATSERIELFPTQKS